MQIFDPPILNHVLAKVALCTVPALLVQVVAQNWVNGSTDLGHKKYRLVLLLYCSSLLKNFQMKLGGAPPLFLEMIGVETWLGSICLGRSWQGKIFGKTPGKTGPGLKKKMQVCIGFTIFGVVDFNAQPCSKLPSPADPPFCEGLAFVASRV